MSFLLLFFTLHASRFTDLEARSYSHKLIEARNRPENNSADKECRPRSQPAVNRPTNPGHCSDAHEKRKRSAVGKAALPIGIAISLRHAITNARA
jgi:hypothetical protein